MRTLFLSTLLFVAFSFFSIAQNWFPLEVGNIIQHKFVTEERIYPSSVFYSFKNENIEVIDSINIEGKKYFFIKSFGDFSENIPIRYDDILEQILVYMNNSEHVFMDFSLPENSTFLQIQNDGSLSEVEIIDSNIVFLYDTIYVKGFQKETINNYNRRKWGKYYFAPNVGVASQDEFTNDFSISYTDFYTVEYLIIDESLNIRHKKHSNLANINFLPVLILPINPIIEQEFKIEHVYSILSGWAWGYPITGYSYIKTAALESYYTNGIDTIVNTPFTIQPVTEIDFNLSYPVDTNYYNQGYFFYYRIIAEDKGIIPSYYYKPDSGYYKLYWRDTTTNVSGNIQIYKMDFNLFQNFPNPFNPSTKISWQSPLSGWHTLKIYDVLGNEVATLVNEYRNAGSYELEFDAEKLSSGVYYYQLRTGSFVETKKMIYLK